MTDPIPVLTGRLDRVERRQDVTDTAVAALATTAAVHTEQIATQRTDLHEVGEAFKEASAATNKRIDRLLAAAWALVVVLIPIAYALLTNN